MDFIIVQISAIVCLSILIAYKLYQWRVRYKLPPGPYPLPIIGNLHSMEPDRADYFRKLSTTYGPIISFYFGSQLNIIVSSSDLAEEVLKDNDEKLANRHRNMPTNLITHNGKDLSWADYTPSFAKLRKICALELFCPNRIEGLRPIREDEVKTMIHSIFADSSNEQLVLRNYIGLATFNIITRMVFGKTFSTKEEQGVEFKALAGEELKLEGSLGVFEHIWLLNWIVWLRKTEFSNHVARRNRLIDSIIEEHKMGLGSSKNDFVEALVNLDGIDQETMRGLLWDLIAAGIDTSALTVEWGMAEIVRNPRVQIKVQEELDRVIGPNRTMSESDITNLTYLQCVVKEVLRLHPPTPLMLPHKASCDVRVGGFDVPKGAVVYVNVRAIGIDPKNWDEPLVFRPERFMANDVDVKGREFKMLPFGAGRRMCPAAQMSLNLVAAMIGRLCHHFRWRPVAGVRVEEIDMTGSAAIVNYMKYPLQVAPQARLHAHLYNYVSK